MTIHQWAILAQGHSDINAKIFKVSLAYKHSGISAIRLNSISAYRYFSIKTALLNGIEIRSQKMGKFEVRGDWQDRLFCVTKLSCPEPGGLMMLPTGIEVAPAVPKSGPEL